MVSSVVDMWILRGQLTMQIWGLEESWGWRNKRGVYGIYNGILGHGKA